MAGAPCARKGRQPLQWKRPCRPLQRKRPRRPLQWPARPVPGWRTLRLACGSRAVGAYVCGGLKYVQICRNLRFVENIFELRANFQSLFQRL